nr:glutaredoxin domain-containing protein [Jeotgalibacillus sp. R-1-5s-1]
MVVQKVVLYTQPQCPPCEIVKKFFRAHEIQFEEINIKNDVESRQFMIDQLASYSTPTVLINDAEVVRGFNLEELAGKLNIVCE